MKKNELSHSPEYCLNVLKGYVKNLSLTLDEHDQSLIAQLRDYFTVDIATEWDYQHFEYFINILLNENKIDQCVVELFKTIIQRFQDVPKKEEAIWTLEGFKSHPFWQEQRKLAKELLTELEKIQL